MLIAIDPGKSGAIAGYATVFHASHQGGEYEPAWTVEKLANSPQELAEQIKGYAEAADRLEAPRMAILEEVSGYVGVAQPASRAFVFGRGYGQIEGVLATLKFQIIRSRPQVWQGVLSILSRKGETKPDHKRRMRAKALDLFPHLKPTLDTADALLILYAHVHQHESNH